MKCLVSCIDDFDLFGCIANYGKRPAAEVLSRADDRLRKKYETMRQPLSNGPLHSALCRRDFDRLFLFFTCTEKLAGYYIDWIQAETGMPGDAIRRHVFSNLNVIAYPDILAQFTPALEEIWKRKSAEDVFTFCLTGGTPSMIASLVLLGKTKFPASFLQVDRQNVISTEIPFDLVKEWVPDVVAETDKAVAREYVQDKLIGESPAFLKAVDRLAEIARHNLPILITGESGTGKEVFARAIHGMCFGGSAGGKHPFIPINCGAIPEQLLESELFGHTRGAFTGANADQDGAFQAADNGTLFLDEIGEMPLSAQVRLLRATQWREESGKNAYFIQRVGAFKEERVSSKLVFATNRDLSAMVKEGKFRQDLYYRIKILDVHIPPLRERGKDVILLAEAFLKQLDRQTQTNFDHRLEHSAKKALIQHHWPGNIRELFGVLQRIVVIVSGQDIQGEDIEREIQALGTSALGQTGENPEALLVPGFNLQEHLNTLRSNVIRCALRRTDGIRAQAARMTGYKNIGTFESHAKEAEGKKRP